MVGGWWSERQGAGLSFTGQSLAPTADHRPPATNMNLLDAILLGIVQGLTEFIPISSSAHLILAQKLLGVDEKLSAEQMTAFIAVIQLGTLLAVIIYFWRDIITITLGFLSGNLSAFKGEKSGLLRGGARLGWLIVIGSIPIAVIGLGLKDLIEGEATKNLYLISASMIVWALLLWLAERVGSRRKEMDDLGVLDAVVVGVAQAFALIPGSSRSGTTLTGALFAGIKRETAARFSFLLSIPAIGASGLLELREAIVSLDGIGAANLLVATIAAAIVGYASIAFLLAYLRRHSTGIFIIYRLLLGLLLLALLYGGRVSAN